MWGTGKNGVAVTYIYIVGDGIVVGVIFSTLPFCSLICDVVQTE